MKELEEGTNLSLDFSKIVKMADTQSDVIPVAVQNADTKEVILVAYVNQEALEHSLKTKTAAFWSTSRNELWIKGATSGETFDLLNVFVNCEQNSLLYVVRPRHGAICHTKNQKGKPRNCFYRHINFQTQKLENINP